MTPISLKRGVYAGAVTAGVSLLAAAVVGMVLLARSLQAGHTDTKGTILLGGAAFVVACALATAVGNVILVRPSGRVSRGRVAAAVIALTAVVPLCALLALYLAPHTVRDTGLLFGISVPTAVIVTLVVYVWAITAIPWVNRSATPPPSAA